MSRVIMMGLSICMIDDYDDDKEDVHDGIDDRQFAGSKVSSAAGRTC